MEECKSGVFSPTLTPGDEVAAKEACRKMEWLKITTR